MTSQVSLSKPAKPRRYNPWMRSFWQTAREGWAPAALAFAVYAVFFLSSVVSLIVTYRNDPTIRITDVYSYCFFFGNYMIGGDTMQFLPPVIIYCLSVFQGVFAFKFLFSRKSTNAWFSMGISRRSLFLSRYLAGAALALLPLAAGLGATLAVNLSVFPETGLILKIFFFELSGLCVQALAIYTITAAVCAAVGTWLEAAVYSAVAAAAPTAVLFGLNMLMRSFLFGNCFGVAYSDLQPRAYLFNKLAAFNPLMFFYRDSALYSDVLAPLPHGSSPLAGMPPVPFPWAAVGWLAGAAALAWLAWRLFKARKVETAGVMGLNRPLAYACTGVVVFFIFSVCPYTGGISPDNSSLIAPAVTSVLCLGVGYGMLAAMRAFKKPVWKSLVVPPACLTVSLAVVGILYAGGLGYSGFVPDKKDVSSIAISYKGAPDLAPKDSEPKFFLAGFGDYEASVKLTDAADFDAAIATHRSLVSAGRLPLKPSGGRPENLVLNTDIHITYTLKNGAVVARDYNRADVSTLKKMLALDETQGVRRMMQDVINGSAGYNNYVNGSNFKNGLVYLSSKLYGEPTLLRLNGPQRAELIRSIAMDVAAESLQGRYTPAAQEKCVLLFCSESWSDIRNDAIGFETTRVFVSEEYRNTLEFLKNIGALDTAPAAQRIEWIKAVRLESVADLYNMSPVFLNTTGDYPDDIASELRAMGIRYAEFTDPASIGALQACCFDQYACLDGGYLLYCKLAGSDIAVNAFVPAARAPAFLADALK